MKRYYYFIKYIAYTDNLFTLYTVLHAFVIIRLMILHNNDCAMFNFIIMAYDVSYFLHHKLPFFLFLDELW